MTKIFRLPSDLYPTDLFSLAGPARSERLPLIQLWGSLRNKVWPLPPQTCSAWLDMPGVQDSHWYSSGGHWGTQSDLYPHRPVQLGWTCQEGRDSHWYSSGGHWGTQSDLYPHRPVQLGWTCQEGRDSHWYSSGGHWGTQSDLYPTDLFSLVGPARSERLPLI